MSFASVLHTLNAVLGATSAVATPLLGAVNPAAGSIFATAVKAAALAEQAIPPGEGSGAKKKEMATAIVTANHPGSDPAATSLTLDQIVQALNLLAQAQAKTQ